MDEDVCVLHVSVDDAAVVCVSQGLTDLEDESPALSLVPLEEFEDTLAIEKIVTAGTERFWLELESIMLRLGSGLDIEPDAVELPVSPRTICSAYRQSLQNIDFPM